MIFYYTYSRKIKTSNTVSESDENQWCLKLSSLYSKLSVTTQHYARIRMGEWMASLYNQSKVSDSRISRTRANQIPWRRTWKLTPVFLPGESHGQKSLQSIGSQTIRHDWSDLACMPAKYSLMSTLVKFYWSTVKPVLLHIIYGWFHTTVTGTCSGYDRCHWVGKAWNTYGLPSWLRWLGICLQCSRPGFNPWRRECMCAC